MGEFLSAAHRSDPIGEGNDGSVSGLKNPDEKQRQLRRKLGKIYPPIIWRQTLYEKDQKTCIRVETTYSGDTPHFGDAAWIRKGSESVAASDEMLQKLVDLRSSKARELSKWLGKPISVSWSVGTHGVAGGPNWSKRACEVADVTAFFATFRVVETLRSRSEPLAWLELSWDDDEKRLRVFVNPQMSLWV